jgi:hypothetical protein
MEWADLLDLDELQKSELARGLTVVLHRNDQDAPGAATDTNRVD